MPIVNFITFVPDLIQKIPLNLFDFFLLLVFLFYIFTEADAGFISAFFNLSSISLSYFGGLLIYPIFSALLMNKLYFSKGLSNFISLLIVSVALLALLTYLFKRVKVTIPNGVVNKFFSFFMAGSLGIVSFFFLACFFVSLILSFPSSGFIKDLVRNSLYGQFLAIRTNTIEMNIRMLEGKDFNNLIGFITTDEKAQDPVKLNFVTEKTNVDKQAENDLLVKINEEREKEGLAPLVSDDTLNLLAKNQGEDMASNGFISTNSTNGLSLTDRLSETKALYTYTGENVALSESTEIAMNGFLKNDSQRENILNKNFTKAGIAVIDTGAYGKMFVQEFSD